MLKDENNEYQRLTSEEDKRSNLVPEKYARKAGADYVVKKGLVVWGDSSSQSGESECRCIHVFHPI